jgi:WD40 repeat protein
LNTLRNYKGGSIRSIFLDNNRNYLFTGSFDDGEINVFDLDKPGREKLAKLNATLHGKDKIRAITWSAKRAEIMTGTADGSITFWNAVEGKTICTLSTIKIC